MRISRRRGRTTAGKTLVSDTPAPVHSHVLRYVYAAAPECDGGHGHTPRGTILTLVLYAEQGGTGTCHCSTCNTVITSHRYKCASCDDFNLCRACYRCVAAEMLSCRIAAQLTCDFVGKCTRFIPHTRSSPSQTCQATLNPRVLPWWT